MAKHYPHFLSKKEKEFLIKWCLAAVILVVVTIVYFVWFFIHNCIFHWPPRLNSQCWNEQKAPAHEKGLEAASQFVP